MIDRKIRRSMPTLLAHPPLLAHTIYQALAFDDALREAGFSLSGTLEKTQGDNSEWEGVSDTILGNKEWFDAWLEGERKCKRDSSRAYILLAYNNYQSLKTSITILLCQLMRGTSRKVRSQTFRSTESYAPQILPGE